MSDKLRLSVARLSAARSSATPSPRPSDTAPELNAVKSVLNRLQKKPTAVDAAGESPKTPGGSGSRTLRATRRITRQSTITRQLTMTKHSRMQRLKKELESRMGEARARGVDIELWTSWHTLYSVIQHARSHGTKTYLLKDDCGVLLRAHGMTIEHDFIDQQVTWAECERLLVGAQRKEKLGVDPIFQRLEPNDDVEVLSIKKAQELVGPDCVKLTDKQAMVVSALEEIYSRKGESVESKIPSELSHKRKLLEPVLYSLLDTELRDLADDYLEWGEQLREARSDLFATREAAIAVPPVIFESEVLKKLRQEVTVEEEALAKQNARLADAQQRTAAAQERHVKEIEAAKAAWEASERDNRAIERENDRLREILYHNERDAHDLLKKSESLDESIKELHAMSRWKLVKLLDEAVSGNFLLHTLVGTLNKYFDDIPACEERTAKLTNAVDILKKKFDRASKMEGIEVPVNSKLPPVMSASRAADMLRGSLWRTNTDEF